MSVTKAKEVKFATSYPVLEDFVKCREAGESFYVRRALRSILSEVGWFLISILAIAAISYYDSLNAIYRSIPILGLISPRWLAIIPVAILLEILRQLLNDLYVFDISEFRSYKGRIALNYNVPAVKYSDIKAIVIRQDIMGRLLNYGDVLIGTAAHSGFETSLDGVYAPESLATLLRALTEHNHRVNKQDNMDESD